MSMSNDIKYIGVNDHVTDLFESQYPIKTGVTYNSYVIMDEKIAVFDTVGEDFAEEWFAKLDKVLEGKTPDYLIVQHMEPDHSASIDLFAKKFPATTIVSSAPAFNMMKQFFGCGYEDRKLAVKEGDTLSLGKHELSFVSASMVHWPEVTMTYDKTDKILFSADGFGRFGAPLNDGCCAFSPEFEDEPWADEARRYYIGIVGKYGVQVQAVLKKAAALEIETICPLHGPVLTKDLGKYIDLYDKWSSYTAEDAGITVCFSSVYGHTKAAVQTLIDELKAVSPDTPIACFDLARCDVSEAVASAFRYDRLVLATTTYNMDIFPCMKDFINHMMASNFQNRKIGLMENGTWAPKAAAVMKTLLEKCPNLTYCDTTVSIKSAMNDANKEQIKALAAELV